METGGAGDGHSWVERTEDEDDFKRCRPAKRLWSQSKKQENRPTYPFPLQDEKGRCNSTQEIYRHLGQQLPAHHNVATMGITYLHLEVLPQDVRSLGNQVLCMIAEYHLAGHTQGSSSLSPVLLEAATELLPPLDKYIGGVGFCVQGQDPPNCRLATLPRYGGDRERSECLPDSGGCPTSKGLSCGSTSGSHDGQPHLCRGCWLGPG